MQWQNPLMHKKEWQKAPPHLLQFSNTSVELEHTSQSALHCVGQSALHFVGQSALHCVGQSALHFVGQSALHCVGADYCKCNDNAHIFRRLPKAVAESDY
jgi:hypothetical protein